MRPCSPTASTFGHRGQMEKVSPSRLFLTHSKHMERQRRVNLLSCCTSLSGSFTGGS